MKRIFLTIIFSVTCISALFAQAPTTSFDVDGIKVIFKPTVKNMVSVRVYFRGGVTNYSAKQAGIERMTLGALLQCGTTKHAANDFKDIGDYYNIDFGAAAEYDFSDIEMSCISKYFDKGWELLAEAINNPIFDPNEVQLLKNTFSSAVKQAESSPDNHVEQLLLKNAFAGTVYATDPDGTEESINSFTPADLKSYYSTMLNKNKMFIVIAGKLTQQEITEKVKEAFSAIPASPYQPVALTAPTWNDNHTLVEGRSLATNYIAGIMNAPVMTSADYIPFKLGISAFSGNLFSLLRTQHNLSYDPDASTTNQLMPYATMSVSTTSVNEAITLMVTELNRIKGLNISKKGVEQMKSSFITSNYMKLQSSSAITGNLGVAEIMGGWNYFENLPAMLDQVTSEQITKAMQKYLVGVRWGYLGDIETAKQSEQAFRLMVR
jgi:zinc protease